MTRLTLGELLSAVPFLKDERADYSKLPEHELRLIGQYLGPFPAEMPSVTPTPPESEK